LKEWADTAKKPLEDPIGVIDSGAYPGVSSPARVLDLRWRTTAETARLCCSEARLSVQMVFVLRFAVGAVSTAQLPQAPWRTVLGMAAWWCAVSCAYLLNGVTDVREDRANGSRRPIARGDLPVRTARPSRPCWPVPR